MSSVGKRLLTTANDGVVGLLDGVGLELLGYRSSVGFAFRKKESTCGVLCIYRKDEIWGFRTHVNMCIPCLDGELGRDRTEGSAPPSCLLYRDQSTRIPIKDVHAPDSRPSNAFF